MAKRIIPGLLLSLAFTLGFLALDAQNADESRPAKKEKAKKEKRKKEKPAFPKLAAAAPFASLNAPEIHEDFPVVHLADDDAPVVVFIANDGEADRLELAGIDSGGNLVSRSIISKPKSGNLYQPCLARLEDGSFLCAWSELGEDGQWDLWTRGIAKDGTTIDADAARITRDMGNDIFPDLGTDRMGRPWLVWQRFTNGVSHVFAKVRDKNGTWSDDIPLGGERAGNWEPRLAFGEKGEAFVVFDSYRNGDFDLFLCRISPAGKAGAPIPLAKTPRYEARGEAAVSPDGKSLWVIYETGMERWGKDLGADWRKKGGGLHHDREIKLIRVDLSDNAIEEIADVTALLPDLVASPGEVGTGAIDVPEIIIGEDGAPWVFFRYCLFKSPGFWQTAYARMNPETREWTRPEVLGNSAFCLDRRTSVIGNAKGSLVVAYPSDSRKNKQAGDTGIFLAKINIRKERPLVGAMPFDLVKPGKSLLAPYNETPERSRDDHHTWKIKGEEYTLYWGGRASAHRFLQLPDHRRRLYRRALPLCHRGGRTRLPGDLRPHRSGKTVLRLRVVADPETRRPFPQSRGLRFDLRLRTRAKIPLRSPQCSLSRTGRTGGVYQAKELRRIAMGHPPFPIRTEIFSETFRPGNSGISSASTESAPSPSSTPREAEWGRTGPSTNPSIPSLKT